VLPLDPRLHFALNCGGRSCPPIGAYAASRLDEQLHLASLAFLAATATLEPGIGVLRLSRIFRWYQSDFGGKEGVLAFVADHTTDAAVSAHIAQLPNQLRLQYDSYDWRLNRFAAA
jgi:hypothetical protein